MKDLIAAPGPYENQHCLFDILTLLQLQLCFQHQFIKHIDTLIGPDCAWKYIYPNFKIYLPKLKSIFVPLLIFTIIVTVSHRTILGQVRSGFSFCQFDTGTLGWRKMQLIFIFVTSFSCKTIPLEIQIQLHLKVNIFLNSNIPSTGCFGADTWLDPQGVLQLHLGGTEYPRWRFHFTSFIKRLKRGKSIFFPQVGGIPSWNKGLERCFEDDEDDNICGLWQRVQTEVDQLQILPWHKVHFLSVLIVSVFVSVFNTVFFL